MQPRDHKAPLQGIITCTTPENAHGKIKTLQDIIKQLGPWGMKQQLAHKKSSKQIEKQNQNMEGQIQVHV